MSNEPESIRMWREINATRDTTQEHTTRIRLIEAKVDGLSRELSSNLCQVCNKLDDLSEQTGTLAKSVHTMQTIKAQEEKQAGRIFDRWLPLILGVVASALAVAKYLAP